MLATKQCGMQTNVRKLYKKHEKDNNSHSWKHVGTLMHCFEYFNNRQGNTVGTFSERFY